MSNSFIAGQGTDREKELLGMLRHGAENALTRGQLCAALGVDDDVLRATVKMIRRHCPADRVASGFPLSDTCGARGYFLPSTDPEQAAEEIAGFWRMMFEKARGHFATAEPVKRWLRSAARAEEGGAVDGAEH